MNTALRSERRSKRMKQTSVAIFKTAPINSNYKNLRPSLLRLGNTKTPTLTDRRFCSDTELKQAESVLGFGEALDASNAELLGYHSAAIKHFHLLNVDIPFVAGGLLGPGPVVAKLGTFATLLTLRHSFFAPLLSYVRSFPPLIVF
jgi:hypothetical protein